MAKACIAKLFRNGRSQAVRLEFALRAIVYVFGVLTNVFC
jgi:hypothetical protein